ncbi:MAG: RluA family pseudouridine synthase [Bacteroidales bacterium]|nr:RluA family pseudouridine synthase [Bacteroidales bacterium]
MSETSEELPEEERELYEHYRVVVDKKQSALRVDKFLVNRFEGVSRNRIQNAAKAQCIRCNDLPVKSNYKIKPEDIITLLLPHPPRDTEIFPEDIPLDIVYEDNSLLIVNKNPDMVVHPGFNNYTGTLLHALLFHFQESGQEETRPLLVHRIDKDTSGLMVVCKEEYAQTYLAKQFFEHSLERRYVALVWGDVKEDEGLVEGFLGRAKKDRRMVDVYSTEEEGKFARTHYRVLERFGWVTLIECRLETGRTHQIRAHMKYLGHPLFSDEMYGGCSIVKGDPTTKFKQFVQNCFKIMPRQALHAKTIGFIHPETKKEMRFDSELPEDFLAVIDKWRRYMESKKR